MAARKNTSRQLTLDDARRPTGRGGWRPGAGRPQGRTRVSHDVREDFSSREPLHVTLRLVRGLPSLRDPSIIHPLRGQLVLGQRTDFRIVHFNIEDNHIHLIIECEDKETLGDGIGNLTSRLARRLNRLFGRAGDVFDDRYHMRVLRSPREVRNALRYVLNNYRHHAAERGEQLPPDWIDPFSSAAWFDGWRRPIVGDTDEKRALLALPAPVSPPTVWLLTTGWRKHGLIDFDEVPGVPVRRTAPPGVPVRRTAPPGARLRRRSRRRR